MIDASTIDNLRDATLLKLNEFRESLKAYKRAAKKPPLFLHEKRPVKMREEGLGSGLIANR